MYIRLQVFILFILEMNFSAFADFRVKNQSGEEVRIAFAYVENGIWYSEGWWTIKDGETRIIYNKDLKNRYYYYYAVGESLIWKGEDSLFVDTSAVFKLQFDSCSERKWDRYASFRMIDVGKKRNYTVRLTEDVVNNSGRKRRRDRRSHLSAMLCPRF